MPTNMFKASIIYIFFFICNVFASLPPIDVVIKVLYGHISQWMILKKFEEDGCTEELLIDWTEKLANLS